jgi:hypothetical protein
MQSLDMNSKKCLSKTYIAYIKANVKGILYPYNCGMQQVCIMKIRDVYDNLCA